ncbi:hypothetical protein RHGRI_003289 [Rhododendron griersonianum]|uniref:Uncharacterized protein n=1 Tax=Rhododendron griersonianum TaxID=479676 RepID=A0AAV6L4R2_9ERIC|nr:hypothetical protein RHGRI_003289 [Rhododendron griersonianum]
MAGGQPTPSICDMIAARAKIILALPATVPLWKTVLCAGTIVLSLEGASAMKEWLGNWRENRRDRVAYLERKVSYLGLELAVTEYRLRKIGQGKKKRPDEGDEQVCSRVALWFD